MGASSGLNVAAAVMVSSVSTMKMLGPYLTGVGSESCSSTHPSSFHCHIDSHCIASISEIWLHCKQYGIAAYYCNRARMNVLLFLLQGMVHLYVMH